MKNLLQLRGPLRIAALLFGVLSIVSFLEPGFLAPSNLLNLILQISIDGVVAIGLTLVILCGGLDLSVGAVMALSGVFFVSELRYGLGIAGLTALLAGTIVGFTNGLLISKLKLNPLIITLGTMAATQGLALWFSRGYPLPGPGGDFEMLGGGSCLYIPLPIVFFCLIAGASHCMLGHTQFGRDLYAIGGDREAARLADIPMLSREWWVYVLCSVLAAFAGMVLASRLNTGS